MDRDGADRYCTNCGHGLRHEDAFCPGCGRPAHQTARVPTPEAEVPVSPPPAGTTGAASGRGSSSVGRTLLIGGLGALLILLLAGAGLFALRGLGGQPSATGGQPEGIREAGQQPTQGTEEPTGYVLLPEGNADAYRELLFLQVVREGAERPEGGQAMRGYLSITTAFYEPGLPVAQAQTNTVEGTIDDASLQFTEETYGVGASASATTTFYYGTVEGSRMELTRDLPGAKTTWVGEEGTLQDYHEEVEELVRQAQEESASPRD